MTYLRDFFSALYVGYHGFRRAAALNKLCRDMERIRSKATRDISRFTTKDDGNAHN